jgi:hypothetical protein
VLDRSNIRPNSERAIGQNPEPHSQDWRKEDPRISQLRNGATNLEAAVTNILGI